MSVSRLGICLKKIKTIMNDLVMALSDETYIEKIQSNDHFYMYEDVKSKIANRFNEDFINGVFSECQSYLWNIYEKLEPEILHIDAYDICRQIMAKTLYSFNESNYLDDRTAQHYIRQFNVESCNNLRVSSNDDYFGMHESVIASNRPLQTNVFSKLPFHGLLRWFGLIFEMKLIFGDTESKLENFDDDEYI
ncbi:hypothetical protein RF11_04881 [Thelohanellus kitauei]|uniref:Uncharacterized protein n=1 Tax=Thelohanellus kitauei TaxID=669202 RepID=A0A0C2N117_THEKT|nr:hypothetical protein RF11_04881 [Thelohanellus kitauei]